MSSIVDENSADMAAARADAVCLVQRAVSEPMTAELVSALSLVDPGQLDGKARVALIRAWERAAAWVAAGQQRALAAVIDATEACGLDGDLARHEVGAALKLSPHTAGDRTRTAAALVRRLPHALAAMQRGEISYWRARALADGVRDLPDCVAAKVEAWVLARASGQSLAATRRTIDRAVIQADRAAADARARAERDRRQVSFGHLSDGQATLIAIGPAPAIETIRAAVMAVGDRLRSDAQRRGDTDPGDAARFDALVAMCASALDDPDLPRRQHARPAVQVAIDLPTALGLADEPAELLGYGPIPPAMARDLVADGDWTRFVTAPLTGELLDVGRDTYRPSRSLSSFVVARDQVCGFPHCNNPAWRSDIDHVVTFVDGGRTVRTNLGPVCRQHHNAKTHGQWRLTRDEAGHTSWTSPLGGRYDVSPVRHPGSPEEESGPDPPPER